MSGWIKIDKTLTESMRFKRVVRALVKSNALCGVTNAADNLAVTWVLGALIQLWMYADTHVRDDDTLAITIDEIDELVNIKGFANALPADWLQVIDPDQVQLPNFLAHNGSSEKYRRDNARRQSEYRHRHSNSNVTRDVTASNASNDARPDQRRPEKTRPEKKVPTEPLVAVATPGAEKADPIQRVFDHWRDIHRKPRAQLDAKRRKLIRGALGAYSEADLCQAISGYLNSPHHMGQNDRATVYDSIELLLRDAEHIDAGLKFHAEPPRTDLSEKTRRTVAATADWEPPEVRHAAN